MRDIHFQNRCMICRCCNNNRPIRSFVDYSPPETFAPAYLNAYVANDAVVGARFGDLQRDAAARSALAKAFPGREIVMLKIDQIADGGGGIHCLTQPMPQKRRLGS